MNENLFKTLYFVEVSIRKHFKSEKAYWQAITAILFLGLSSEQSRDLLAWVTKDIKNTRLYIESPSKALKLWDKGE